MAHNNKIAFFDMDGTIIAPLFRTNGKLVTGFIEHEWVKFCADRQAHAYDNCVPVKPIIDFAKRLKSKGYDITLLSVIKSASEKAGKENWLDRNVADLFTNTVFVSNDTAKMHYLRDYVTKTGIDPNNVILVEDNLLNVLEGCDLGIKSLHISHIITGAIPFAI